MNRRQLALGMPFLLVGCDKPAPPAPSGRVGSQTPPITGGWFAQHSVNVQLVHSRDGFYFDFPVPPGSVHYIVRPSGAISGKLNMTYRLSGGGTLQPLQTPGSGDVQKQATIRPYFQRTGDNLSGVGPYQSYRWWAAPSVLLPTSGGVTERTVPLAVEHWSDVYGGKDILAFASAMLNCGIVGFTCGSESFAGHGVQCTAGSVRFELLSFSVG